MTARALDNGPQPHTLLARYHTMAPRPARMRRRLISQGILDEAADDQVQRSASAVAAAVEEARRAPSPDGPQALDNVFSKAQEHG